MKFRLMKATDNGFELGGIFDDFCDALIVAVDGDKIEEIHKDTMMVNSVYLV